MASANHRLEPRHLTLLAAVWSVFTFGMPFPAGSADAKTFTISITGDQGAAFIGSCLAKRSDDHEVLALHGNVPFEQQIEADFVSCRINAEGRIAIDVRSDAGQHRKAETTNGMVTLSLR